MKIFHLTSNSSALSGGSRQLIELGNGQLKMGHDVYYGFRIKNGYPYIGSITRECKENLYFFRQPGDENKLFDCIRQISPDIIHVHCKAYKNFLHNRNILKLCPIIINVGHSEKLTNNEIDIFKHPNIKKIICVSKSISNEIFSTIGEPYKGKIATIYSATNLLRFSPREQDNSLIQDLNLTKKIIIGAIGSLYEYKGYQYLLNAVKKFQYTKYADKISVIIVGRSQTKHGFHIKKLVEHDDFLKKVVNFTDGQYDIPRYISIFSFLVSSSNSHEGISGVIREAMAMKIPVICTDVGGNCEIAKHHKTAILIPPNNSESLYDSTKFLIENLHSEHVKNMIANAYKEIHSRYNLAKKNDLVNSIYKSCIKQR